MAGRIGNDDHGGSGTCCNKRNEHRLGSAIRGKGAKGMAADAVSSPIRAQKYQKFVTEYAFLGGFGEDFRIGCSG